MTNKFEKIMANYSRPRKWFTVNAENPEATPEVLIYDMIGADFWGEGINPKAFKKEIDAVAAKHDSLTLRINSPGGFVHDGFAIYNALTQSGLRITTYVDGLAASAAAFIAMAGDEILIPPSAEIMIHDAWGFIMGTAEDMSKEATHLQSLTKMIADIFVKKTGNTIEVVADLMKSETWMDGEKAVSLGFATELLAESKIAACSFDIDLFENMPEDFKKYQNALKKRAEEKSLREAGLSRAEAARRTAPGKSDIEIQKNANELITKEFLKWQLKVQ